MRVYIAAQFRQKELVKQYAKELEQIGIECTSSWVREQAAPTVKLREVTRRYLRTHANIDLADIDRANVLVLLTVPEDEPTLRGGRHTEAGYFIKCMRVSPKRYWNLVLCGPIENIFHHVKGVKQTDSWEQTKELLLKLQQQNKTQTGLMRNSRGQNSMRGNLRLREESFSISRKPSERLREFLKSERTSTVGTAGTR